MPRKELGSFQIFVDLIEFVFEFSVKSLLGFRIELLRVGHFFKLEDQVIR
jgi:hypothetical protein